MNVNQASRALADQLAAILDERKGQDIVLVDIEKYSIVADGFLLVSGRNTPQVQALADALDEKMAERGVFAASTEGYATARWIIKDFGDILVHIFHSEDRAFYNLERLWDKGGNIIRYELDD
jgi:ribosome-associated protein